MSTSLEKRISAYNNRRSSPRKSLKSPSRARPSSRSPRAQGAKGRASHRGSSKGRGSATRGWGVDKPQRGVERHELHDQCGSKCFLRPATEGFPICPRLESGRGCTVDCRGVHAAYTRARQYHYDDVADKAAHILEKKCEAAPGSRAKSPRKSPRSTKGSRASPRRR